MPHFFAMEFIGKKELADGFDRIWENRIGTLLFAVLETDFKGWLNLFDHYKPWRWPWEELKESMIENLAPRHPFFEVRLRCLLQDEDSQIQTVKQWLHDLVMFQSRMKDLVSFCLDREGPYADLTTAQRYYLYLKVRTNAYIEAVKLQETVCYESRFSVNKKSVLHIPSPNTVLTKRDVAVVKSKPIKGSVFYTSDDLRAMVYLSVEHMINHGIEIVRCDNCGRYFVPYSGRARFCNRPVEGGKTCRDVGPWRQYEERVRTDPVAKMLQKNSHAYYMRSWRNGAVYSREDYLRWQLEAKEQLLRYQEGESTQEQALEAIQMPKRK